MHYFVLGQENPWCAKECCCGCACVWKGSPVAHGQHTSQDLGKDSQVVVSDPTFVRKSQAAQAYQHTAAQGILRNGPWYRCLRLKENSKLRHLTRYVLNSKLLLLKCNNNNDLFMLITEKLVRISLLCTKKSPMTSRTLWPLATSNHGGLRPQIGPTFW